MGNHGSEKQKLLRAFKKASMHAHKKDRGSLTPLKAAESASVNRNTGRWACLRLLEEGKIRRLKHGHYVYVG